MQTIQFEGRTFRDTSEARHAVREIEWARVMLFNAPYVMPNGRDSHVVASEVIDAAEDRLIDDLCMRAVA